MPASRLCRCGTRIPGGNNPRTCKRCTRRDQQKRAARRPERRTNQAIKSNAQLVAEHRLRYGDWCPGLPSMGIGAHPAADLTADHLVEVALGGSEHGPRVVRCRSCNSKRSATVRRTPA